MTAIYIGRVLGQDSRFTDDGISHETRNSLALAAPHERWKGKL